MTEDEIEFFGGPWDGLRQAIAPTWRTQLRHMPGRTDAQPAELATYVLAGQYYLYRPDRAASREDTQ